VLPSTAIATILGTQLSGELLSHFSARMVAPGGFAFAAAGHALPAIFDNTAALVGGLSVAVAGLGAIFVTAFTVSLGDAAAGEAGLRSAVVNIFHELGGAAGVAVASSAAGAVLGSSSSVARDFSHAFSDGTIAVRRRHRSIPGATRPQGRGFRHARPLNPGVPSQRRTERITQ